MGEPALGGGGVEEVERALRRGGGGYEVGEVGVVEVALRRRRGGWRRRGWRGGRGASGAAVLERGDPRERGFRGCGRGFHGRWWREASRLVWFGRLGLPRGGGRDGRGSAKIDEFLRFWFGLQRPRGGFGLGGRFHGRRGRWWRRSDGSGCKAEEPRAGLEGSNRRTSKDYSDTVTEREEFLPSGTVRGLFNKNDVFAVIVKIAQ